MKSSLVIFLLAIAGIYLASTFSIDQFIKSKIEETGSEMTKTPVTVEGVSVSLFSGEGTIEGIRVQNPEGFESEHAAVIQNLKISMDLLSVFSDTIRVHEIIIDEPLLSVIQKVPENNLRILLNNMEESLAEDPSESNMVIERLVVNGAKATVTPNVGGERSAVVNLESIEFENLGKGDESATHQVVYQVTERVVGEILRAALRGQLDELTRKAKEAIEDIFD